MGQKVQPIGFRTGEFSDWKAHWFASARQFKQFLLADVLLRRSLLEKLKNAGVVDIVIDRLPRSLNIRVLVTRPGMVIGRGGAGIEELKEFVRTKTNALTRLSLLRRQGAKSGDQLHGLLPDKFDVTVEEVKEPELSARLVATRIVAELERRLPARRVATRAVERVLSAGAAGVKIVLSGRLGGAEIARRQKFHAGSVPSQTLRADIDYAQKPALLKRGYVGVKVWIHKKEVKS